MLVDVSIICSLVCRGCFNVLICVFVETVIDLCHPVLSRFVEYDLCLPDFSYFSGYLLMITNKYLSVWAYA